MANVKSFTIDRARWGKRRLRNDDGTMCCLGFFSEACGVPPSAMGKACLPRSLERSQRRHLPAWALLTGYYDPITDVWQLVSWNDRRRATTSAVRRCSSDAEAAIKKIFAKHGVKVRFTGKRP